MKEVAKVGIIHDGKMLMGVRTDNGKWTEPGGHLEAGETPLQGAIREVREEAGIKFVPKDLSYLGYKEVSPQGKKIKVHAFKAEVAKAPTPDHTKDPDKEVFGWNWVPMQGNKLPAAVNKNLHVPAQDNVLHFFLGFEKSAAVRTLLR